MSAKEKEQLEWMASLFDASLSAGRLTVALLRDWLSFQRKQYTAGSVSDALLTAYVTLVSEYEGQLS